LADELAKGRYSRRNLLEQLQEWFDSFFVPGPPSSASATMIIAVIIGALLVVGLVVLVRRFPRGLAPRARTEQPETAVGPLDEPDQHRRAAAAYRAAGDHAAAVIESYRALVSSGAGRDLLHPVPGLTAQRAARRLATHFPSFASQLARAADCFDLARYARVRFGGSVITAADSEFVADLERRIASAAAESSAAGLRGAQ
jgi:hypothetical protein